MAFKMKGPTFFNKKSPFKGEMLEHEKSGEGGNISEDTQKELVSSLDEKKAHGAKIIGGNWLNKLFMNASGHHKDNEQREEERKELEETKINMEKALPPKTI